MKCDELLWLPIGMLRGTTCATLLALACAGCEPPAPQGGGASATNAEAPDAPTGEAIADPVLREARAQVDAVLADLLAGKLDQDENFAPVARKLKGYRSWSIKSQQLVGDGAADFRGVLTAPGARAMFDVHFVKQGSGKWAIGTFGGPIEENPQ